MNSRDFVHLFNEIILYEHANKCLKNTVDFMTEQDFVFQYLYWYVHVYPLTCV